MSARLRHALRAVRAPFVGLYRPNHASCVNSLGEAWVRGGAFIPPRQAASCHPPTALASEGLVTREPPDGTWCGRDSPCTLDP